MHLADFAIKIFGFAFLFNIAHNQELIFQYNL